MTDLVLCRSVLYIRICMLHRNRYARCNNRCTERPYSRFVAESGGRGALGTRLCLMQSASCTPSGIFALSCLYRGKLTAYCLPLTDSATAFFSSPPSRMHSRALLLPPFSC